MGRIGTLYLHFLMIGSLSARALDKGLPIAVADNRSTFRGTVAHCIGEIDALEERFYLLVEGCAANDYLVDVAAESLINLVAYLFLHLLAYHRHIHEQADAVVLYLRENLLAYDLLDNQRHGDDNPWLHVGKSLCNDGRRGHTGKVEDVAAG